jgi:hypothetical protein
MAVLRATDLHAGGRWTLEKSGRVEQRDRAWRVSIGVSADDSGGGVAAVRLSGTADARRPGGDSAEAAVAALYRASAAGLIRMAYVMLDDLPGAEDVVQEAFCGLYR